MSSVNYYVKQSWYSFVCKLVLVEPPSLSRSKKCPGISGVRQEWHGDFVSFVVETNRLV